MADFVGAVDQGTTSTRFMLFDHSGAEIARHQLEHTQVLPRAGWVEHNPVEIWERTSAVIKTVLNTQRLGVGRPGRARPDQPAGDHHRVEPPDRPPVRQRHRLAGHPDRRHRRRPGTRRERRGDPAQVRPAARHLLLRRQAALDARARRRPAGRRRAGRGHLRHRGHLAAVEPDRRDRGRRPRHRRDQRQPHHADGPGHPGLGRRAARAVRRAARRCCPGSRRPSRPSRTG